MPNSIPTWAAALSDLDLHLRSKGASPLTIEAYTRAVRWLESQSDWTSPASVSLQDLRTLLAAMLSGTGSRSGKPLSPNAAAREVAGWRALFRLLHRDGLIPTDPTARLDTPRVTRRPPGKTLTIAQVRTLLEAADTDTPTSLRDRALVELVYATGLRRGEVCALDLTDIDHDEREVLVRHGKGGKTRLVPLARPALEVLRRYLRFARPILANPRPDPRGRRRTEGRPLAPLALYLTRFGSRLDAQSVRRSFLRLGKRAKLNLTLTPHMLRRTFSTHLLKNGVSVRHLQLLLGHSSLDTTALYLRLDSTDLRRELLLRHPREQFE